MNGFNSSRRRRWRGPPLGGRLQRGARFCFDVHGGVASTEQITEWCRPEIVLAGGRASSVQLVNQCTALRSIGATRIRRVARQWLWQLPKEG
jgi:hypothetical protein